MMVIIMIMKIMVTMILMIVIMKLMITMMLQGKPAVRRV